MARQARQPTAKAATTIRLPDDTEATVRALAAHHNRTMGAVITELIEDALRSAGLTGDPRAADPTLAAIKTMTLAALEASYGELGFILGKEFVLRQFRTAMDDLFAALPGTGINDQIGHAAAQKVLNEMRAGGDTPLGAAGRELGLTKEREQ
jgi:plasmid stability protein